MIQINKFLFIALAALTSGCFGATEEIVSQKSQFDGQTVAQVSAVVGPPTSQDHNKAIWNYKDTYTQRRQMWHYMNGKWFTSEYQTEQINAECIYTATLFNKRIKTSTYEGNDCSRFSPKIKL